MGKLIWVPILLLCAVSRVTFADGCTKEKVTLSWKQSCKSRVIADKLTSGTEYKIDPCQCGVEVFGDITKLATDNTCTVNADTTLAVFMNEKFKATCLDKK